MGGWAAFRSSSAFYDILEHRKIDVNLKNLREPNVLFFCRNLDFSKLLLASGIDYEAPDMEGGHSHTTLDENGTFLVKSWNHKLERKKNIVKCSFSQCLSPDLQDICSKYLFSDFKPSEEYLELLASSDSTTHLHQD